MPLLILVMIMIFSASSYGQERNSRGTHEVSLWSRNASIYPWYFYTGEKFTADLRYNFDEDRTAGFCLGKQFGKKAFSVIPEACEYIGQAFGLGPELWILSETDKISIESYVQYVKMFNTSSYGYIWLQSERKITRHFGLGLGGQALKVARERFEADLGPALKFTIGKRGYMSLLPMWRITPGERGKTTLYTGFGWTF